MALLVRALYIPVLVLGAVAGDGSVMGPGGPAPIPILAASPLPAPAPFVTVAALRLALE